ncbi:sigma-E factor negative regulatory protein [Endozoicomonas sp. Mp262]|uniref:sigma-E factor negative regulatory protein n=1 Tax=Endozoicomonas sp. Mp262 TaxID=2919499 RepID=UPI0021DB6D48
MSDKNSESHARERLNEALSASMDGQASELELHRVLDTFADDGQLRNKARRYQLIGDSVRRDVNEFASIDLSKGVMASLEQEESLSSFDSGSQRTKPAWFAGIIDNWAGAFGRVAVAASVVFAVVLGVHNQNTEQDVAMVADSSSPATLNQPVQISTNDYGASGILAGYSSKQHDSISPEQLAYAQSIADRATRERFRAYALQHAELSVMSTGQGVLPFARLTSFDVQ